MSKRFPALLLAILVVPLAAASPLTGVLDELPGENPLQQNDAGSGADAPNVMVEALAINPGDYVGELLASPVDVAVDILDGDDWYRIWAPAGAEITIRLALAVSGEDPLVVWALHNVLMELRSPAGVVAGWNQVPRAAGQITEENYTTIASETGWWFVHMLTPSDKAATEYAFSVQFSSPQDPFVASSGNGYVLLAFEVKEGGSVQGETFYVGERVGRAPVETVDVLYRGMDFEWINGGALHWFSSVPNANVNVAGQGVVREVPIPGVDRTIIREHQPFHFADEPGLYFFLLSGMATQSYLYIKTHVTGKAKFLGSVVGGSESIFALTTHDFQGTLAGQAGDYDVVVNASAELRVKHRLHGYFDCGTEVWECSAKDPTGALRRTTPETGPEMLFRDPIPGPWTLTMERSVDEGFERFVVFAIDLELPKNVEKRHV